MAAAAADAVSPVQPSSASHAVADDEAALASAPAMIAMIPIEPDFAKGGATHMPEPLQDHDQQDGASISFEALSHSAFAAGVANASKPAVESVQQSAVALATGGSDGIAAGDEDSAMDVLPAAFALQATVPAAVAAASVHDMDAEAIGEATLVEQQLTLAQAAAASYDAPSLLGSTDEARLWPSLRRAAIFAPCTYSLM